MTVLHASSASDKSAARAQAKIAYFQSSSLRHLCIRLASARVSHLKALTQQTAGVAKLLSRDPSQGQAMKGS